MFATIPGVAGAETGDAGLPWRNTRMNTENNSNRQTLGWREWLSLPDIGITRIKAKVDTGARTSCLHAFYVDRVRRKGRDMVRFGVHPVQNDNDAVLHCEADILDQRQVTDSGGHRELRFVIETRLQLLDYDGPIELTLTNRDNMRFRMLLGRTAMARAGFQVDPARSYLGGKLTTSEPH